MKAREFILAALRQVVIGLLGVGVLVSCSDDIYPPDDRSAMLYLRLDVGVPEGSRTRGSDAPAQSEAPYYAAMTDNEKISTLRIIISRPDGEVEVNTCLNVGHLESVKTDRYRVVAQERKTIYVIANEPPEATGLLASFRPADDDTPGKPVNEELTGYVLSQPSLDGASKPIPMSAVYRMDVYHSMDADEDGVVDIVPRINLLRTATKFTVNVKNREGSETSVRVCNVKINSVADREFLFGRVIDNAGNDILHSMTLDSSGRLTETATGEEPVVSGGDQAPDDFSYTDYYRDEYQLVNGTTHTTYLVKNDDGGVDLEVAKGAEESFPSFYVCESMPTVENGGKPFSISLDKYDGAGNYLGSLTQELPNLSRLPRNTHVVININATGNDMDEWTVEVIPFTSIVLQPEYGLDREDFTGYVIGKDKEGHKCWYDNTGTPYYLGRDDGASFVSINEKEYLLVYDDYARMPENLHHIYEKETRIKHMLDPVGITGYAETTDFEGSTVYVNKLQQYVWLDSDFQVKCCRTLNEWDRNDWNKAYWWHDTSIHPKYWFDVLGNRYPWEEGDTPQKRKAILKEWVQYLE